MTPEQLKECIDWVDNEADILADQLRWWPNDEDSRRGIMTLARIRAVLTTQSKIEEALRL